MDPLTIAAIAGGVQALGGAAQTIFSGRKKAENELNAFAKQSPLYQGSKSISDYYQQAMNRYNENPYQSQQYQLGAMNAQRATAQGIGALQDRRSAIGGIGRLALGQNTAMQNLGAQAEAQRNQRFGQLGQASQAKASEDYKMFDINKMTPYNRQLQLKQLAAQAANDRANAGLQMVGSALGGIAQAGMMGGQKTPGVSPTGVDLPAGNLAKNDATLNNFFATRGKINPNYIPNARGVYSQNSTFMNDMSNWNKARSLGG
jgi:hypothetical protein